MDRGYWNQYKQQRVEELREQRVQKMAARLQLHSDRPRTISSSVLGYGNYEQQLTVQPGHMQHNEGPRFNHGDQRWNSNYSGFRDHYSPRQQYHHQSHHRTDQRLDHRMDHRGHGSYHQYSQKKVHYSSHRTLYNDRKPVNKPHRKYSSCNDVKNTNNIENVSHVPGHNSKNENVPEQNTEIFSDNGVDTPNEEVVKSKEELIANNEILAPALRLIDDNTVVESAVNSDNSNSVLSVWEIPLPESPRSFENSSSESNEVPLENNPPESNRNDGGPSFQEEIIGEDSVMAPSVELVNNKSSEPIADLVGDSSIIAINVEVADNSEFIEQVELHEQLIVESESIAAVNEESVATNVTESLVSEPEMIPNEKSTIAFESIDEQVTDNSESEYEIADNTLGFELSLSYEPDIEVVVTDSAYIPDVNAGVMPEVNSPEPIHSEPTAESIDEVVEAGEEIFEEADQSYIKEVVYYIKEGLGENEEIQNSILESGSDERSAEELESDKTTKVQNPHIVPALVVAEASETEAVVEVNDIAKELETVKNKLANISIVADSDHECLTPIRRARKNVLLDATNIIQSSTIKYAVRQGRKNDEKGIIVTPVRRSLRMSSVTPISKKNICVQNIEELSPEVIQKMKFVPNPAIDNPSNC